MSELIVNKNNPRIIYNHIHTFGPKPRKRKSVVPIVAETCEIWTKTATTLLAAVFAGAKTVFLWNSLNLSSTF